MKIGWEKYKIQVINYEDLWNMELPKTSNELEKKMVQCMATRLFWQWELLLEGQNDDFQ
jgi:hypothetical protein